MSTTNKNTSIPLYFNSKDRVNIEDSTADYTIKLRKDLRNISSISVSSVGIPRSFTNINRNNNALLVIFSTESGSEISISFTVEVANRNYTEAELATALQDAFNVNQTSVAFGLVWTISYDTNLQFFSIQVQYNPGLSTTWGISFGYTPLVDVIGIGDGGTTTTSYVYTTTNTDVLTIDVNRKSTLYNNLHFNITSQSLSNDINTSYVTSLAKSFSINSNNNTVVFDTIQTLTKYTLQLAIGTGSIGPVDFGSSLDISGDGQTVISGAPGDDGYTGAVYTYVRPDTSVGYFQTPTGSKTQTALALSSNGQEGTSVALSTDALTMITGAPGDDSDLLTNNSLGAAYIYAWTGTLWVHRFKITPLDVQLNQELGMQVAISGDGLTVAVASIPETLVYRNLDNIWTLSGRFTLGTNPQLNSDGTILTLFIEGFSEITISTLTNDVWGLTQTITSSYPIADISDDGTILVVTGGGSVNIYIDTGTYVLDGDPLTKATAQFGASVAISGDGTTIVVGDPTDTPGLAYVYTKPSTWTERQILDTPITGEAAYGSFVRVSTDGQTIVVGGPWAESSIGNAWVWRYNNVNVEWEAVIETNPIRPDGATSDTDQGYSSSIAHGGNVFVTGGPFDDDSRGAVWVYQRDRFTWNQVGDKIVPSDISAGLTPLFGTSVAISGDGTTFAVGAKGDVGGGPTDVDVTGAVWVYRYDTVLSQWTQQGNKIFGTPFVIDHYQGTSVSLSGDGNILAIGAPRTEERTPVVNGDGDGDVFIFVWSGTAWVQQGSVLKHSLLAVGSTNGWSVSLNEAGDIVVIGAPNNDAVSIFTRSGTTWTENATLLTGTGGASSAAYGSAVSISPDGTTIAVGAPGVNFGDQGYVEIWTLVNSVWTRQTSITETPFAGSIDLSYDGNVLCVGALDSLNQVDVTSRTYVYTRSGGVWTQFDDPIVGERRTHTEDFQGYSSSVEYIDSTDNFTVIIGGIGIGPYMGGNWAYISEGTFTTTESYTIPTRAYTIFDLINVLNTGLATPQNLSFIYNFDDNAGTVTITVEPDDNVSATFAVNLDSTTFDVITFNDETFASSHESLELDFSINNNIIKSINTSYTSNPIIYDIEPSLIFRKYEAGYTISSSDVIDIQLRDERDQIVDLYGANWIMTAYATIHN